MLSIFFFLMKSIHVSFFFFLLTEANAAEVTGNAAVQSVT